VDLAERFPEIDFLMGHCGSTDFWNDVDDAALAAPNIYLETSLARPFSIPGRIKVIGKERVIMGSYAPVNNFTFEWNEMDNVLSADEAEFVMGGNMSRLLSRRQ
jgi:predicted TIM-barrel fold metal-dependent hydrolase